MNKIIKLLALSLCLTISFGANAHEVSNFNYKRGTRFGFETSFLYCSGSTDFMGNSTPCFGEVSGNVGYSWGQGLSVGFYMGCLFSDGALFNTGLSVKYNFVNEKISPFIKVKAGISTYFSDVTDIYQSGSIGFGLDFKRFSAFLQYYAINMSSSFLTSVGLMGIGIGYNF
jgi:hypothetical protein